MTKKVIVLIVIAILALFMFTGCVPGDERFYYNPAGFFWGLWHGCIWFITFFMGIFTGGRYTIYEAFNTGWLYNLGFLLGLGAFGITIKFRSD